MRPIEAKRFGCLAMVGCLMVPLALVSILRPASTPLSYLVMPSAGANSTSLSHQSRDAEVKNDSFVENEVEKLALHPNEKQEENRSVVGIKMTMQSKEKQDGNDTVIDNKEVQISLISSVKPEQNHTTDFFNDKSSVGNKRTRLPTDLNEKTTENQIVAGTDTKKLPQILKKEDENNTIAENEQEEVQDKPQIVNAGKEVPQESKLVCDFSGPRSDTCALLGDIRILTKSSTIILNSLPQSPLVSENSTTRKLRPYARKWESSVMQNIKEITITPSLHLDKQLVPPCSVNHTVPAVIFSTGGFLGNFFHDFTDVLVPLFATSHHFQGEVQFLTTDFNSKWINKYKPILKYLSNYQIINMESEHEQVHCFPEAHVGLLSHKVLGIDSSRIPNNYTMIDFKHFLRSSLSLNKDSTQVIPKKSRKKPRLLMILRQGSRSIINAKAVISMARSIGFKVITAGPEDTKDLAKFAQIVNSCDAIMGVHGAGLANMVFLPINASLIQIIPWGGLKWACWHDFGEPAVDMGVKYVEYEIKEEESSLIQEYPRDHAVFKDPESIQRQGWNMLWSIFLNKQKVKLDVGRFRMVLLEIYRSLKQ